MLQSMSFCVPDLGVNILERELFSPPDLYSVVKGKVDTIKPNVCDLAFVPSYEPDELTWLENQFAMQGANARGSKQSSWAPVTPEWAIGTEQRCLIPKEEVADKERTLHAIHDDSVRAVDVPLNNLSFQDEMISWLAYPLDDSLERDYCSGFFEDLPNPNIQQFRDSFTQQSFKDSEYLHHVVGSCAGSVGTVASNDCGAGSSSSADIAMVLGAGRAAGLIPQSGAEAFNKVRTAMQPSVFKCTNNFTPSGNSSKSLEVHPSSIQVLGSRTNGLLGITESVQNSKAVDASATFIEPTRRTKAGTMNFSHFSRPVAETKANLHIVGVTSGPTNIERARQQYGKAVTEGLVSRESTITESATTVITGIGSCRGIDLRQHGTETSQYVNDQGDGHLAYCFSGHNTDAAKGKKMELDTCLNPSRTVSVVTATEKGTEVSEMPELTITSPSRGSGNSTEKSGKEAATSSKRKACQGDESEYQSEDAEEVAVNAKKPPSGRSTKRSRAAEIHNLSERRRRDRINEKMRALQELIPNSNKTDKASMLDEAIEYLKMLQSQLQMMSMRTGIGIPPLLIPMGMQQMQQMPALPRMGVGVGVGMGMGMGMVDVGVTAAGQAMVPMPPIPEQALAMHVTAATSLQPSGSSSSIVEPQSLQNSGLTTLGVLEPYNALLSGQQLQPVHLNMHMNVDMYNAFVQQHQQQHQQQWQLRQCQPPQGHSGSKPTQ